MRFIQAHPQFLIAVLLVAMLADCSFGPPPSCGENIGGTADTTLFDQYFTNMQLVSQATGLPGPEGENGLEFTQGDSLVILAASRSEVNVRLCIQPRGAGEIAFDRTQTLPTGDGMLTIGTLEPGIYVIRVIVDDTLVKNFPFTIK